MPLTFAHPAAILPFSRKSNYINFSAMVLGSMSPDFEYFINGRPLGEIGHTFSGFIYFNLPLVIFIYLVYHTYVHETLLNHLPFFLQDTYSHQSNTNRTLKVIVLIYSSLFGMLTHVIWDSFTHVTGRMVTSYPEIFTKIYPILDWNIPVFKIVQHGSTLIGLIALLGYVSYRAMHNQRTESAVPARQKLLYWFTVFLLTIVLVSIWSLFYSVSIFSYGTMVVRIIDSFFISLFFIALFVKDQKNTGS